MPEFADGQAVRCMLVFRGRIGQELDGVAGQVLSRCPTRTEREGPLTEDGLPEEPTWASRGCPLGTWAYRVEICCHPQSPPTYAGYCARSPLEALRSCWTVTAFFLNCRIG